MKPNLFFYFFVFLFLFFPSSTAVADHVEQRPSSPEAIEGLLQAVVDTGRTIYTENSGGPATELCRRGIFGAASTNGYLVVCLGNHRGDGRELADTIRHETIHFAQFCNN